MTLPTDARPRQLLSGREHSMLVVAILVLQAIINAAYTLYAIMVGKRFALSDLPTEFVIYAYTCGLWYLMYRLIARGFGRPVAVRLLVATLATLLATVLFVFGVTEIRLVTGVIREQPPLGEVAAMAIWSLPIFVIWALVVLALAYGIEARERGRLLARANHLAQQAQLQALRYQINPHFLYNTLNSISALILDRRNQHADDMVLQLSNFVRSSLAADANDDVRLAQEIDLQATYLSIERVRFEDQLQTHIEIPADLADALVPNFILQPLVENAIKHGLGPFGSVTELWLRAHRDGGQLVLEVENRCSEATTPVPGTGVGLRNVRERLAARFGSDQSFVAGPTPQGGFAVRLVLPLRIAAPAR